MVDREIIPFLTKMNLEKSIERIIELFAIFKHEIEDKNKAGLFDVNRLSEDVLVPILRDIFDCPYLRNLNREAKNYPGIDLADASTRTAFQVTSESGLEKVADTLTKVIKHQTHLLYDRIFVYILKNKANTYSKAKLQAITKGYFAFDPTHQIIDSRDLIERIQGLDYSIIKRIEETLEVHFANPSKYFVPPQVNTKSEALMLNLLPISIPNELYIAATIYDRDEVIESDKRQLDDEEENGRRRFTLKPWSSERAVIWAALRQNQATFSSDWVVRGRELLSFHNLRDDSLGIAKVIDTASADSIPVRTYLKNGDGSENLDHLNIFKDLLRKSFQAQIKHRGIRWQHKERVFFFSSANGANVRKESWSKSEGRQVYKRVLNKHDRSKTLNHEHLAFDVGFDVFEGQWYLSIKPTMLYSWDGYGKSKWHKSNVAIIKKKDRNHNVLEDLCFITEILRKDQTEDLLAEDHRLFLKLGELIQLVHSPFLDDAEWLKHEEKEKRKALTKSVKLPLLSLMQK